MQQAGLQIERIEGILPSATSQRTSARRHGADTLSPGAVKKDGICERANADDSPCNVSRRSNVLKVKEDRAGGAGIGKPGEPCLGAALARRFENGGISRAWAQAAAAPGA